MLLIITNPKVICKFITIFTSFRDEFGEQYF